jgi:hypothetical protein
LAASDRRYRMGSRKKSAQATHVAINASAINATS